MILSYYSDDSDLSTVGSKVVSSEKEGGSSTGSQYDEHDSLLSKVHSNGSQEDVNDVASDNLENDGGSEVDYSEPFINALRPDSTRVEDEDTETCNYCSGKANAEECKICSCGLVCCGFCYESVLKCGYLCEYTCEHCCDRGVYCNRRAILQCEKCSVDHRQRCGCDCIHTPDESSEEEEYRGCDYCNVEHALDSFKRCACGVYCCPECFSKVEKCGYMCDFTCEDCCDGVYCCRGEYLQCKVCAADHTERCGCNDSMSGTENSSEYSKDDSDKTDAYSFGENSDESDTAFYI